MISSTINNLVDDLKPRHREVISSRFGLDNIKNRETLATLGDRYGITRERVRQIEAEALDKIREEGARGQNLEAVVGHVEGYLRSLGGLRREDFLIDELKSLLKDKNLHFFHLKFLSEVTDKPLYYIEDGQFHPFWYLNEEVIGKVKKILSNLEQAISKKKDELILEGKFSDYLTKIAKSHRVSDFIVLNYVSVSRKFRINPFGDFGLASWEEINPKTVGSKSYLVIKKLGKPLHFRDVADHINKLKFDSRKALPQTIHNELIKDPRFVLVGRGIYGLREQGFRPGTAKDIISYVLRKEGPLSPEKVVNSVLKQRFLEKNTIILNLQNKKLFKRLPDGRYRVSRS